MLKLPIILVVLFACCSIGFLHAQEITILDEVTQERIPGVKIYSIHPKVQKIANIDGRFRLEPFIHCDSIFIAYKGFETKMYSYDELKKEVWIELKEFHLAVSEMVVSASRWKEDKAKSPVRITKINLKDAALLEPQTAADLLESSGYVFVQKSQFAGGSPQLRGFGTNRVMLVVDGVRMNNAIFRSGNLQNVISIDGNSLESAEIQFGPGAVLYGSDAIGGVMNFTTLLPKFAQDSLKAEIKTTAFTRYSSSSNESTSHLSFNFGKEKWATISSVTYSRFGDLTTGKFGNSYFLRPSYQQRINGIDSTVTNPNPRKQINTEYSQINLLHKAHFKPNKKWLLTYSFLFSQSSDAPRYDRLTLDKNEDGVLDNAEWYYGPQKWMMNQFTFVNQPTKKKFYDQLKMNLAYQKFNESRNDRKTGSSAIRRQFEQVDAFSLNIDFHKEWAKRTTFVYGLEGVFNLISSEAHKESIIDNSQTIINPRYPDQSTWQTYGVYADLKHALSEKWTINSGIRYSLYFVDAQFDTSLFAFPVTEMSNQNSALNGSLGFVLNSSKQSKYYLNLSTGFRAPNIDDFGKVFDSEPGNVIVPNVNLKPEYAYNTELGFAKAFKSVLKIDGAVYYTYLQDALARSPFQFNGQDSILYEGTLSQVLAIQNNSNAYVYGTQAGIELIIGKGFSVKSTINYQKGSTYNLDSATYFPKTHVAPVFGRTSLGFKRRHLHLELYLVYQGEMKAENLPLQERNDFTYAKDDNGNRFTPSWYTLNFKGAYFFNKHLSMNAGVENITNQLYRTFGSGVSASGVNVTVSLKAVF